MNTELILQLQAQLTEISTRFDAVEKTVNGLKINDQKSLFANAPIPPGVGCKVAYDKNGLITGSSRLEITDIPQLDFDKITNLRKTLEDKASARDFDVFKSQVTEMIKPAVKDLSEPIGVGTKFNYSSDGRILSVTDLLPSDIPQLPISKIDGLQDIISSFYTMPSSNDDSDDPHPIKTTPGTYIKVNIDNYGRVINGEKKLTMEDLPSEIIVKLNQMETRFVDLVPTSTITAIQKELSKKLGANTPIISGTFTKVRVDSNGLVTHGEKLTINDLPELQTSNIVGLDKALRGKAEQIDLINLSETVSSLVGSLSHIGEISGIKQEVKDKASNEELTKLSSKVKTMQSTVDSLVNRLPSDMYAEQLNQILNEISMISGRLQSVEHHLGIKN